MGKYAFKIGSNDLNNNLMKINVIYDSFFTNNLNIYYPILRFKSNALLKDFFTYSLGRVPNCFLKQVLKYLGSENPTI